MLRNRLGVNPLGVFQELYIVFLVPPGRCPGGHHNPFVFGEKYSHILKKDTPLIIKGRISGDEDRKSIRAEDIVLFKDARDHYKKVFINFDTNELAEDDLKHLYELINNNKGKCEVWFKINNVDESCKIRSRSMKIKPEADVLNKIRDIVGDMALKIFGGI